jgi:hypothetical protein
MHKSKSKARKIQKLLTDHLLNCGVIELRLPDGINLEIGITKEGKDGVEISDDYCFVKASRDHSSTLLDTHVVSMQYEDSRNSVICLDNTYTDDGTAVKRVEVV